MLHKWISDVHGGRVRMTLRIIFAGVIIAALASAIVLFVAPIIFLANNDSLDAALKKSQADLQFFTQYYQSDPIVGLTLASSSTGCPADFTLATLYNWPGTLIGCNRGGSVTVGSCTTNNPGTAIPITPTAPFSKVANDYFCVQKIPSSNYIRASTCPSDYKQCYPGFCVDRAYLCPITSVRYTPGSGTSAGTLSTSINPVFPPITDIFFSFYGSPCFDFQFQPIPASSLDYPLLSKRATGCGSQGTDPYFTSFYSQSISQVFADNTASQPSSGYSNYASNTASLGYRSFPGAPGCPILDDSTIQKYKTIVFTQPVPLGVLGLVSLLIGTITAAIGYLLHIKFDKEGFGKTLKSLAGLIGFGATIAVLVIINTSWRKDYAKMSDTYNTLTAIQACNNGPQSSALFADFNDAIYEGRYMDRYMTLEFVFILISFAYPIFAMIIALILAVGGRRYSWY